MKLARLYHTVRYLKPVQFINRFTRKLPIRLPETQAAPLLRAHESAWIPGYQRPQSVFAESRFRLLNQEHDVCAGEDWNCVTEDSLWLYNLHYFDDLNAIDAAERREWHDRLIHRWITDNPPGRGIGWDPYPISLRVVNWIKADLRDGLLSDEARKSLAQQVRWLEKRLEFHLLANHLFANAKALVFAGMYFAESEGERWLRVGMKLLNRELREQVLEDGGHFERSPMYHQVILEDVLDLINLQQTYDATVPPWWWDVAGRMLRWVRVVTHPNGEIPFFNDAANGISPSTDELIAYAERLGLPVLNQGSPGSVLLDTSGFGRLENSDFAVFMNMADIGPGYQPGHAHADTLSLEVSVHGKRVLVNSGTSRYGISPEREWQRSTAAHSTLTIDNMNSTEVWGGFRVARRARVDGIIYNAETLEMQACHDGYTPLRGHPTHERKTSLGNHALIVEDTVHGKGVHTITGRWYLHPEVQIKKASDVIDGGVELITPGPDGEIRLKLNIAGIHSLKIIDSEYFPEFGKACSSKCIEFLWEGELPVTLATFIEKSYGE